MMETATENRTDTVKRQRWGWLLFVFILAGLGYLFAQVHGVKEDSDKVPVAVAAERLDIGEQWETKEFRWTLPIKNTTANNIHVAKFLSECPCMTFDPPSLTVSPGQEVEVRITCDMTAKCGQNRDLPIRDYAMPIAPADADGKALQKPWVLHGKVRSAIQLERRSISFGETLTCGQPFATAAVKAQANTPLRELIAHCAPESASVQVKRLRESAEQFEIRVTPNAKLPPGPFKFQVGIRPVGSDGTALLETVVWVEGTIVQDARIEPSVVVFPIAKVGQALEETVVLRCTSKRTFEVQKIEVPDDTRVELAPGPSANEYRVTQRIARREQQTAHVTFVLRYLDSGTIEKVNLPISYYGTNAE